MYKTIHYHLDDFDFAQAKKLVRIEGGVRFEFHRDDLFPFIKLQKQVLVKQAKAIKEYMPVAYIEDKCIKLGFISSIDKDLIEISTVKGFPKTWNINRKFILGQVQLRYPFFIFRYLLKRCLISGKYKLLR